MLHLLICSEGKSWVLIAPVEKNVSGFKISSIFSLCFFWQYRLISAVVNGLWLISWSSKGVYVSFACEIAYFVWNIFFSCVWNFIDSFTSPKLIAPIRLATSCCDNKVVLLSAKHKYEMCHKNGDERTMTTSTLSRQHGEAKAESTKNDKFKAFYCRGAACLHLYIRIGMRPSI